MRAIGRHPGGELVLDGPGFEGFSGADDSWGRHRPDVVVWYKPLEINRYDRVPGPRVLRYNEMWDVRWTTEEIEKSGSKIVICHHRNDMPNYGHLKGSVRFFHCPHCAEKTVFKPVPGKKTCDVLLTGVLSDSIYPLRGKFRDLFAGGFGKKYRCKVLSHPGYRVPAVEAQAVQYAKALASAKIVVTCSSRYHYALAKYIEVGLCGTCLVADIPGERQEWYTRWVVRTDPKRFDRTVAKIKKLLKDRALRQKYADRGRSLCLESMTQEHYAERFVRTMELAI